ncbi:MAG: zinc ribbon domain-containing protein [Lachnospiraceae bacterium]|nr:zinc ribbon domain-containing protein [Lachnospiraceae bacterium]
MEQTITMKCKTCGSNLGIEDEVCPYCGRINEQAAGHREEMQQVRDEYERTRDDVKVRSRSAGRIGRLAVIGAMLLVIAVLEISVVRNSDVEIREKTKTDRIAREVDRNRDAIAETLRELEKNRAYLAMDCYMLNYRLRGDDAYADYSRVFTAAINYSVIYEDILNIVDGYEGYDEKTPRDWCDDIAIYISDWDRYVGGSFWHDSADSPMHTGEHGAFIADARKDAQDLVQVYFDLTDEQASAMWTMDEEAVADMLYENCRRLYPEKRSDA